MSNHFAKELNRSNYRLLGLVGQGQFGRVFCATHRKSGRLVALKELDKHRFPTHKFLRELRFLLSLQHPNIVNCHALEHTATGRYLVLDYCEGGTLRNLMDEDVRLHPAYALKLAIDILTGLNHAHSREIIHCDIKPENILLTLQPAGWTAHISDFGIAHLSQELDKESGSNTGSPAYMAPERFYGQFSYSSDTYAVGILLYELLLGYRPFAGTPAELMSAHLNRPVNIPASLPPALQNILVTALQKLPGRRFRSTAEMLEAVQAAAQALYPLPLHLPLPGDTSDASSDRPVRLLQPTVRLSAAPYQSLYEEALAAEVRVLTIEPMGTLTDDHHSAGRSGLSEDSSQDLSQDLSQDSSSDYLNGSESLGDRLYQVSGNRIQRTVFPGSIFSDDGGAIAEPLHKADLWARATVRLPEPIQALIPRSQECFAVTEHSVYRVPAGFFTFFQQRQLRRGSSVEEPSPPDRVPQLVAEASHPLLVAIDPQGRWLATAVKKASGQSSLQIWHLSATLPTQRTPESPTLVKTLQPARHLFQLLALDRRYVAAFSHTVDPYTNLEISGVVAEVFTRRGRSVGSLRLPMPLHKIALGTIPHRIIALEPGYAKSILLIDLKPLRMVRVGLGIAPVWMLAAPWGYVLMDAEGQLELLNQQGQRIGCIAGPAHPTAIALREPYGLLITTWHNRQGNLHAIDLRQLDLDIVF